MRKPFENIFLHYFDIHFLSSLPVYGSLRRPLLERECDLATRFAIMASERVLIPVASFAESPICRKVITPFEELYDDGRIVLICSEPDIGSFAEHKLSQYSKTSMQYKVYTDFQEPSTLLPALVGRKRSATADIASAWLAGAENQFAGVGFAREQLTDGLQKVWERTPELLDGRAFTPENASTILGVEPKQFALRSAISSIINRAYFDSYGKEHDAAIVTDLVYLNSSSALCPEGQFGLPYRKLLNATRENGLVERIQKAQASDIVSLEASDTWIKCVTCALEYTGYEVQRMVTSSERRNVLPYSYQGAESAAEGASFDVLVVTALQIEYQAFASIMSNRQSYCDSVDSTLVGYSGSSNEGASKILLIHLGAMGNNSAAAVTSKVLSVHPEIRYVLMSGIAGAVPNANSAEEHVRLGDVVVSDLAGVVQYDYGKNTSDSFIHRDNPRPASSALLQHANQIFAEKRLGDSDWTKNIELIVEKLGESWGRPGSEKDILHDEAGAVLEHPEDGERNPAEPRVFFGKIASANMVQKDGKVRDNLREDYGVRAIEMEASGIAEAAIVQEKHYLVVRGMCDYCDSFKNDEWQKYASVVAAAFSWEIVKRL